MAKGKTHPDFSEVKFKARVLELKGGETVSFAFGRRSPLPVGAPQRLRLVH